MKCFFIALFLILSSAFLASAQTLAVVTQEPASVLYAVDAGNQTAEELYRERFIADVAADPTTGIVYAYDANREELIALSDAGEEVVLNLTGVEVDHLTNGPDGELYLTTATRVVYRYEPLVDSFYVLQGIASFDPIIASENYLVYSSSGRILTRVDRITLGNPLEISSAPNSSLRKGAGINSDETFLYIPGTDAGTLIEVDINDSSTPARIIPVSTQHTERYADACSTADGNGLLLVLDDFPSRPVFHFDYNTEQVTQTPFIGYAWKITTTATDVLAYIAGGVDATVFKHDINSVRRDGFITQALHVPRNLRYDSVDQKIYTLNHIFGLNEASLSLFDLNHRRMSIPILAIYREDVPNTFDLDASGAPILGVSPAGLRRLPCDTCPLDTLSFLSIPEPEDIELIAVDPSTGEVYYTTRIGSELHRRLPTGDDQFVANINGFLGFRDQLLFAPNPARLVFLQNSTKSIAVYNLDSGMTTTITIDPRRSIKSIALDPLDPNKLYAILQAIPPGTEDLYEVSLNSGVSNLLMPLPQGSIALTVMKGRPGISSSTTVVKDLESISAFYVQAHESIRLTTPQRTSAVSLLDASGQQLQRLNPQESMDIDLSTYPSGLYVVSVVIDDEVFSKKIIKP